MQLLDNGSILVMQSGKFGINIVDKGFQEEGVTLLNVGFTACVVD